MLAHVAEWAGAAVAAGVIAGRGRSPTRVMPDAPPRTGRQPGVR
jgi:hypothetical protein